MATATKTLDERSILPNPVTLALSVIVNRIASLGEEDRNEVKDLLRDLIAALADDDAEEIGAVYSAILEILDQEPVKVIHLEQSNDAVPSKRLQSWMDDVSQRIRELRKAAKLSQEQLAEKSGLPQSHISRLESAKHSPSRMTLEKIAKGLGVEIEAFDSSE